MMNIITNKKVRRPPWSVDRIGRLLAGCAVLGFSLLAFFLHPYWLLGALGCAVQLTATALLDRCPMRFLLLRLGAKEREDLFYPGGSPRCGGWRASRASFGNFDRGGRRSKQPPGSVARLERSSGKRFLRG